MEDKLIFQSNRLTLRPFEATDIQEFQAYINDPELAGRRYLPQEFPNDLPLSSHQAEGVLQRWGQVDQEAHLAIVLRSDNSLIGHAEYEWDWDPHCLFITVVIAPVRQKQGYGSEALDLLLRHLFENTPAYNITGWMADWNNGARQFASKHGFKESGCSRREGLRQGAYYDEIVVDILRSEWQSRQEV
jgi:RimJ/RimL family protein N-acetyltransferase